MFWLFSLSLLVYLCFRVLAILAIGNLLWVAEMLFFDQNMFFSICLMNTCATFHLKILFPWVFFFFFFFFSSNLQTLFSAETFVPMPLIVFTNSSILRINSASHKDWVKYFEFQLLFIFHPYCLYRLFLLSLILGRLFWTSDYCSHVNLPLWILGHMLGEYSEPLFSLIWLTLLDTCCHVVYSFLVSAIFLNFFSIRLIGSHG